MARLFGHLLDDRSLHAVSAVVRVLMAFGFNGLSAFEFWRRRDKHLPAGTMLFGIFASYSGMELLLSPFVWLLPAPSGRQPPNSGRLFFSICSSSFRLCWSRHS